MTVVLNETFTTNKLSEYTFNFSTTQGALTVEGGVLKTNDNHDHSFYIPSLSVGDESTYFVKINITGNEPVVHLLLKYIDDSNNLFAQINNNQLHIYSYLSGVLGEAHVGISMASGSSYWLVAHQTGDLIQAEWYKENPHVKGSKPTTVLERTLEGEVATKFGKGTSHPVGLRLAGFTNEFVTTETTVDDWIIETPSPEITNPGTLHSYVGSTVKYQIIATLTEKYKATGLPLGLTINETTGEITGKPTTLEEPMVKLTVEGAHGEASLEFQWIIQKELNRNILDMVIS